MESLFIPYAATDHVAPGPALVLAPHPDDEVLGCAGAILRHGAAGERVTVIIFSDGEAGRAADEPRTADEFRQLRRAESRAAAQVLGYGEPVFWGLPDRGLDYGEPLIRRVLEAIDATQAAVVYAPSLTEMHPDHRALAMIAAEAVRRCQRAVTLAFYEVGVPLRPTVLLDISDLTGRKQAAVECFASQLAIQDYDRHIAALNRYRTYTLPKTVTAAEAYCVVSRATLAADPLALYTPEHARQQALGMPVDVAALPLVSVIIRSSGREAFLQRALDSVCVQTYPHCEIVLVDASGRGIHLPVAQMRLPVRVVSDGVPLLRSRAANRGLETAQGQYLIFLDDDDWFAPDHIAALVERLEQEPQAVAAYAGVSCVEWRDGQWQEVRRYHSAYDPVWLLLENTIPIHALLFRHSACVQTAACRFDEGLDIFEDWDFWLQLQQHGPFLYRDAVSAYYRIHAGSGAGVAADEERAATGLRLLLDKWRPRWTTRQAMDIVARVRHLRTLLDSTETQRAAAVQRGDELQLAEQRLHEHLHRANQALDAAAQQLQDVGAHNATLTEQLQTLERHLHERETALAQELARVRSDFHQAVTDWETRYSLVVNSRSWQLTAPLRAVLYAGRALPRVVKQGLLSAVRWSGVRLYRSPLATRLIPWIPLSWKHRLRPLLRGPAATPAQREPHHADKTPLVSIIVPVFNHAAYLRQCLDSALSQTHTRCELIVVDDASTDPQVREILCDYERRERVTVLYNDQNLGIAQTQNRALIASQGDIIAFLDCDDYLAPDAVATSLNYWSKDTVYSHSGRINVGPDNREISRISFEHLPRQDYFQENLERMYATHFKMIRRDAFARVGLFDPRFDSAQDYDLLMRIAFHYPSSAFVHPPQFLYFHRFHEKQTTEAMSARQQAATATIQRESRLRFDIAQGRFEHFLSIVMLSFGKEEQTLAAVESLQATVKIPHEIILFDNGSSAQTVDFLKAHLDGKFPNLRVFYNPDNLGPAAGRRAALDHARGPYYLVFDNDERAEPGWLEELLVRAQSQPDVGAVCCKVIFPNGRLQFSGGFIRPLDDELIDLALYDRDRDVYELETAQFRDCDWSPIGATLFTLNPAPFLHRGYPNVFEDAGVSMALRRQGKKLLNSPASWVWHEHIMFQKKFGMKERYLKERYDPAKMLVSVASFYAENRLIIKDEYVWRENRLNGLDRAALRQLLRQTKAEADAVAEPS